MNAITHKFYGFLETEQRQMHALVLDRLQQELGAAAGTRLRCIGRRRDTVICLTNGRTADFPDGLLIKLPANAARETRWNPLEEARHLVRLSEQGPVGESYRYVEPLCISHSPKFIAMPFVKGQTLRQLMASPLRRTRQTLVASYLTGQWLGSLYDQSPRIECVESMADRQEAVSNNIRFLASRFGLDLSNLRLHLPFLIDHYAICAAGNPVHLHGDLNPDNILVDEKGRICPIDPEPIRTGLFGDFTQFIQSVMVIYNRPVSTLSRNGFGAPLQSFVQGFQSRYTVHDSVPYAHVISVIEKLSFLARQRVSIGNLMHPRELIYSFDRWRLVQHWLGWLAATPKSEKQLVQHFTQFR